jgi:predicted membrane channel-forming protein YqfA (hemolysin III family)
MNHEDRDVLFHLVGWILFLACAFLFLYVAMRDGDLVLALASLLFLAGCVVFLIPLLRKDGKGGSRPPKEGLPESDR